VTVEGPLVCHGEWGVGTGFLQRPPRAYLGGSSGAWAAIVADTIDGVVVSFRGSQPSPGRDGQQAVRDRVVDLDADLTLVKGLPGLVHADIAAAVTCLWARLLPEVRHRWALTAPQSALHLVGHGEAGRWPIWPQSWRPPVRICRPRWCARSAPHNPATMPLGVTRFDGHVGCVGQAAAGAAAAS
jgi:hypothetical protein